MILSPIVEEIGYEEVPEHDRKSESVLRPDSTGILGLYPIGHNQESPSLLGSSPINNPMSKISADFCQKTVPSPSSLNNNKRQGVSISGCDLNMRTPTSVWTSADTNIQHSVVPFNQCQCCNPPRNDIRVNRRQNSHHIGVNCPSYKPGGISSDDISQLLRRNKSKEFG